MAETKIFKARGAMGSHWQYAERDDGQWFSRYVMVSKTGNRSAGKWGKCPPPDMTRMVPAVAAGPARLPKAKP